MRDREGNRRLSNATRTGNRDEPLAGKEVRQPLYDLVTADNLAEVCGKKKREGIDRRLLGAERSGHDHRHDPSVAAPGLVLDETGAISRLAQGLAQGRKMDTHGVFIDGRVRPCPLHQLVLGDQLSRPLHQQNEEFQSSCAKTNRLPIGKQRPLRDRECESVEFVGCAVLHDRP
nr:hypothetical protein [Rhizobium bangladeshense]